MKKILLSFLAFVCGTIFSFAQFLMPQEALKLDSTVVYGKLDNGLTYYIKHHAKPAQRADFYIVTNVGAIQETPEQDGLAHFLEHMCFNGSKNFEGNGIISYMESIGAKFGENINAGTGVERTSYMLNNIPVIREGIIDTSLLILHDYAAYVTLDPKEIDKERGVILEEKRTRNTYAWRERDAVFAAIFKGSKYATCSLIGSEENLKNFKPEALESFYKTWYRPDLQAIIVVGDVDVERTEAKIKELFSEIPKAQNPKAKDIIKIPENEKPIVSIYTDRENPQTSVQIAYKGEPLPAELRPLGLGVIYNLSQSMISSILAERFADIFSKPDAPFLSAAAGFTNLCVTMDAFMASAQSKDGEGLTAFKALLTEVERAKKYGFTQGEFERAKANLLKSYESAVAQEPARLNGEIVNDYISHFLDNIPYVSAAYLNDVVKGYFNNGIVSLEVINKIVESIDTQKNMVILYSGPEKDGLSHPTEEAFLAAMQEVNASDIEPLEEEDTAEELLDASQLKGSPIVKETQEELGTTKLVLKNGIEIFVKPTDFNKEEVLFRSVTPGGLSLISDEMLPVVDKGILKAYYIYSGISKFPVMTLSKMLTGKHLSIEPYVGISHGFSGNASPSDFETLLQLLYLSYTDPRIEEEELNVPYGQFKAVMENYKSDPNFIFGNKFKKGIYENPQRMAILDNESISKATVANYAEVYKQLFSDAKGMQLYIVGAVDVEKIKPLLEKYVGSLPVVAKAAPAVNSSRIAHFRKGEVKEHFDVQMANPKSTVGIIFSAPMERTLKDEILASATSHILDMLYTKTIREDEGGTYGVASNAMLNIQSKEAVILLNFDTEFAKSKKLIGLIYEGLDGIAANGPDQEAVKKAKEALLRGFPERQISNDYWLGVAADLFNRGFDGYSDYVATVEKYVTAENIKKFVKSIISKGNRVEMVMNPIVAE